MQSQVVVTIKFGEQKEIHKLILQEFQYGKGTSGHNRRRALKHRCKIEFSRLNN